MTNRGKEIEVLGLRVQVDPLVLASRVLSRQKLLVFGVLVAGGAVTAAAYLKTPKRYTSTAEVLVRAEAFEEAVLTRTVNTAVGAFGSDAELSVLINDLDLYAALRRDAPYDLALRRLRQELKVTVRPRSITFAFTSRDPVEAQRVAALASERFLAVLERFQSTPILGELDALDRSLARVVPLEKRAADALYAFKAARPDAGSLLDAPGEIPTGFTINTPAEVDDRARRIAEARVRYETLLRQYTEQHPEVRAALDELTRLTREPAPAPVSRHTVRAAPRKTTTAADPKLEQQLAALTYEHSLLAAELRSLAEARNKLLRERFVAANKLQEDFQLVAQARVPQLPSEPDRNQYLAIGLALALLLALLTTSAREAVRQTFANPDEIEAQLPVLAVLPALPAERRAA